MFHRYRVVRQADQSDCGPAALATVALRHRMPVGVQQLRTLAGTDRVGTNLLGLVDAAQRLGFSARAVRGDYDALRSLPSLPAIAHVRTEEGLGHFVVLFRVGRRQVIVGDPAHGRLKLSRDEFCRRWTGYLLLMVPDPHAVPAVPRGVAVGPWRRFASLLGAHRGFLAEAFWCALLMTVLGIATSYFVQHLVDSVLVRGEVKLLNALGVGMVLIVLFKALFGALRQYLLAYVGRKADLTLISGYARHILGLPMNFFEMRRVGEILSRVNDAAKVREAISGTTLTAIVDGVLVVISTAVLWCYDWPLALVATAFVPWLVLTVMAHHPASRRRAREAMEHAAQLSAHLVEDASGVETIKAFGAERRRAEEGESRLVEVVQSVFSLQKIGVSVGTLGAFVTGIAGIAVLWYGGHRVIGGHLTIGELMFFYTLLGYMLEPLARLASVNLKMQDALVAVDRLYQIMDLDTEQGSGRQATLQTVREGIELRDVSFRYGCRANVLDGLTLRIPAGARVAIVGESGSGKSTLIKLLMRFYDPTGGRVFVDGTDLRDFDLTSLRERIGLVSQDPFIFNGTIRDNIALGMPEATLAQVIAAARAAGLDEFIAGLPERFDTIIGERGANLSGGQRQRLAIARALLRDPEMLIFDEATSHLDTATERAIQENLRTVFAHKTVVLVAHRLSTIRDADIIYVLRNGRIAEAGTHPELLRNGRYYAELCRAQTDGSASPRNGRQSYPVNGHGRLLQS